MMGRFPTEIPVSHRAWTCIHSEGLILLGSRSEVNGSKRPADCAKRQHLVHFGNAVKRADSKWQAVCKDKDNVLNFESCIKAQPVARASGLQIQRQCVSLEKLQ